MFGYFRRCQDEIGDGGSRLAFGKMLLVWFRRPLRDDKTAPILQRRSTQRAVASRSGEHDADGLFGALFGERHQETIDGRSFTGRLLRWPNGKDTVLDGGDLVRNAKEDRLALDRHPVHDIDHLVAVTRAQQRSQALFVERFPVLDHQHNGLIRIDREFGEKLLDALDRSRRSPHADHQGAGVA